MPLPFKLVSADSHIVEPPDLWLTRIDAKYRDRAPHIVLGDGRDSFVCEDSPRSGGGLGLGLSGAKRLVDDFRLRTAPGEGTAVTIIKWAR